MAKNNKTDSVPTTKKKAVREWRTSTESNGITKSVNVEELDNGGYLIRTNKYGSGTDGKYIDETKKYYSETNPLDADSDPFDNLYKALTARKNNSQII